ncbi:MAG: hypothetical protein KGI68_07050 [Alphaproteobacteria bacterium]|nr:hypothetical protein [Alphaproteobacteria bacterium]
MDETGIQRSASQLIKSYGEKAAEVAAGKVVAMQKAGDDEGMADWLDIMLAIRELLRESPGDGGHG